MIEASAINWLTIPDLTDKLGMKVNQVRRLIEDGALLAMNIDGVWQVPEQFIVEGAPLKELKGTVVVLRDAGFSSEEALNWLLSVEPSLGVSPVNAIKSGRKAEVRRVAQALGF